MLLSKDGGWQSLKIEIYKMGKFALLKFMVVLFLGGAILLAPWSSFSQVEKSNQGGGEKQKAKEKTSGF
ncbi:MAG: hypothetical protein B5M54_01195, partial [Candidatus Aminicenantes bacterium 4484_214]